MEELQLKQEIINMGKMHGLTLNIDNPQTIQDKINWLKIYDVTPLKSLCADKIKIHQYCVEKLGKDICIPIIGIYDNFDDINWDDIPNKFVLKCNHGYNMNIICKNKNTFDKNSAKKNIEKWLNTDFGKDSGQLHYSKIDRKCFIEEYKEDENQRESLYDYKFWCFNGEPKLYTINNEHGHGDILYYDMNGTPIDVYGKFNGNYPDFKKPKHFDLMIDYAKKLSKDFKFVRVDFYEIANQVYLGELTFTPGNGLFKYKNNEINLMVGGMLDIGKIGYKEGVSICITAFKAKEFIKETLDSIMAQTWFETHDNWEVLVGIDYCYDTLEYLQSIMENYKNLRVFMMDSNKGTYVTTNTIMSIAQYDGLIRFDADDIMLPNMIERIMANAKDVDFISFKLKNFGGTRSDIQEACGQKYFKHSIFDEFGGYKDYRCSSDMDLGKRICSFIKCKKIPEVLMNRRIHKTNLTVASDTNYLSPYRRRVNREILSARYNKREDAYIKCITNTYKEIFKGTDISEYPKEVKVEIPNNSDIRGRISIDIPYGLQRINTEGANLRGKRIMRDGSIF